MCLASALNGVSRSNGHQIIEFDIEKGPRSPSWDAHAENEADLGCVCTWLVHQIGVDFALKVINWDPNTTVRLQLWDIAGTQSLILRSCLTVLLQPAQGFAFFAIRLSRPGFSPVLLLILLISLNSLISIGQERFGNMTRVRIPREDRKMRFKFLALGSLLASSKLSISPSAAD